MNQQPHTPMSLARAYQAVSIDMARRAVRSWPGLRGESKLAWEKFWEMSGGRPGQVLITASEIGMDQGTSDRAGRRAVEGLADLGVRLIEIVAYERKGGRYTLQLSDPMEARSFRRVEAGEDQPELFPGDDPPQEEQTAVIGLRSAELIGALPPGHVRVGGSGTTLPAADVVSLPPADVVSLPPNGSRLPYKSSEFLDLRIQDRGLNPNARAPNRTLRDLANGGSDTTSAAEVALGDSLAAVLGRLADIAQRPARTPERIREADELAGWIRCQVGDPKLREAPCVRVAWAILDRLFEMEALEQILRDGKKRPDVPRWVYFTGACRRAFEERGLPWPVAGKRPEVSGVSREE